MLLLIVTVLSRSTLIVADTLVLCLTWHRTYQTLKASRQTSAHTSRRTFAGTLLRDGVFSRCLLVFVMNVLGNAVATQGQCTSCRSKKPFVALPMSHIRQNITDPQHSSCRSHTDIGEHLWGGAIEAQQSHSEAHDEIAIVLAGPNSVMPYFSEPYGPSSSSTAIIDDY